MYATWKTWDQMCINLALSQELFAQMDHLLSYLCILHLRRQHNLPTYAAFVGLVQAFATANHELLVNLLNKNYGAPDRSASVIKRLFTNLKVFNKPLLKKLKEANW